MTRDVWAIQDLSPDCGMPRAASHRDPGHADEVGLLGQAICHRLFSAGLDLDSALSLDGNGLAADRIRHAVAELDNAIKDLRHLMLAMPGPLAGAVPAGPCGDEDSEPR